MKEICEVWQEYQAGLDYQRTMGFAAKWPEFERFKAGNQWPAATGRTKNLPRPVFNMIEMFIRTKRSSILNQNINMIYTPAEVTTNDQKGSKLALKGAQDFTDFAQFVYNDLNQDELNEDFIDDAATFGCGIFHYFWDNEVNGGVLSKYKGALRGEIIDPSNFFVANPQQRDVQKQMYVIISSRQDLETVKLMASQNKLTRPQLDAITADAVSDSEFDAGKTEMGRIPKVTVLTKYFKENGIVYFEKAVKSGVIVPKTCLTPENSRFKINLYPLASMCWQKNKKSFFGSGEVEGIIPNQKAINYNIAMMLLSIQQAAWPKVLAKIGALNQQITNTPGEMLVDYCQTGDGIKFLQPPVFPGMAINIADKVFDYTRLVSGVSEVSTGEMIGTNMAASAIIALQNQARRPIENVQKRFYRTLRNVGRIWEQFFKSYYCLPRNILARNPDGSVNNRPFVGSEYADVEFLLNVSVGPGSSYSEALSVAALDKLFDNGHITFMEYLELMPQSVMPFKEQLLKAIEKRQDAATVEVPQRV